MNNEKLMIQSLPKFRVRIKLSDRAKFLLRRFWKKNGVAITAIFILWVYSVCLVKHTESRVTKEVTEQVTAEMQAEFDAYLEEQERERQMASFLSDDASRQEAIKSEATAMARAFWGARGVMSSDADYKTYGWTICFRSEPSHPEFPSNIEAVVSQSGQFMGYDEENPVVDSYYKIAEEIVISYHDGSWPTTDDFIYLDWSSGRMIARNEYRTSYSTLYWWWGK